MVVDDRDGGRIGGGCGANGDVGRRVRGHGAPSRVRGPLPRSGAVYPSNIVESPPPEQPPRFGTDDERTDQARVLTTITTIPVTSGTVATMPQASHSFASRQYAAGI